MTPPSSLQISVTGIRFLGSVAKALSSELLGGQPVLELQGEVKRGITLQSGFGSRFYGNTCRVTGFFQLNTQCIVYVNN